MNVSNETTAPIPNNRKKQRKIALLLLTLLFVGCAVLYTVYWYLVLRHYQETDNAYVSGNQVFITSQIAGSVISIHSDNLDFVRQGDVLVTLDSTDAQQAFEQVKTVLANSVRQTHQLMINSKQYQANIALQQIALDKAQADLKRREVLGAKNLIGLEDLQHAREAASSAKASLDVAIQQYQANRALVLDTSLEQQPAIKQAATQVRDAWLVLQRTKILSPVNGYISQRSVQLGTQISAGTPLMAVIPADQMWVDANFKETQLANMRIGQSATVVSDLYGDNIVYQGKVVGIDMGTGSAFSLLPAQNATGNWIKVVQRLPVRISLDSQQLNQYPLRIGLSTLTSVDTTQRDGPVLSPATRQNAAYETQALTLDMTAVEQTINNIIQANAS